MEDSKLNTIQFAQSLFGLEPDTPIAHEFDVEFGQTKDRWWSCQRFAECENFFKDELDKLKMIQTSLYECRNRLNKISDKFEQNFIEYLDDMGYCDNE